MILCLLMLVLNVPINADEPAVASLVYVTIDTYHTTGSVMAARDSTVMTSTEINYYNNKAKNYPNAEKLSEPTYRYNCHSYAWYSQDTETNDLWIDYPSQFYEDGSYIDVKNFYRTRTEHSKI